MFLSEKLEGFVPAELRRPMPAPGKYSIQSIMNFAASKPANKTYDWKDCETCFFAQYHRSIGGVPDYQHCFPPTSYHSAIHQLRLLYKDAQLEQVWLIAKSEPHTFGAALKRAQAVQVMSW